MANDRSRRKSALQNELEGFSSFQDAQMDILNKLNGSLEMTLEVNMEVWDNLQHISSTLSSLNNSLGTYNAYMNNSIDSILKRNKAEKESTEGTRKNAITLKDVAANLSNEFKKLAMSVAETANKYSELSNQMLSVTGSTGDTVRNLRSNIVQDIVVQLNKETGGYFNPEKAYATMVSVSQSAGIGSTDNIEAITRPLLLASESMNIDNSQIAKLFSKWYTRYNFSSAAMEESLGDIRKYTAENNATENSLLQARSELDPWLQVVSKGDATKLNEMTENLDQVIAYFESQGIDTASYVSEIDALLSGKLSSQQIASLGAAGYDYMQLYNNAMSTGNFGDVIRAFIESDAIKYGDYYNNAGGLYSSNGIIAQNIGDIFGDDVKQAAAAAAVYYNPNGQSFEDFILEQEKQNSSMEQVVDDKMVDVTTKLDNILSTVSEFFAHWQERFGISGTDLFNAANLATNLGIVSLLKGGLSTGSGGAAGGGAGMLGKILTGATSTTGLSVMGGVAGAAGLASAGYDIYQSANALTQGTKSTEAWSAGAKIGSVGSGAALGAAIGSIIPGFGTLAGALVGAGVGGVSAIVAGEDIGKSLRKVWGDVSGNADNVSEQLESLGKSMSVENQNRQDQLEKLNYEFYQTSDVEEQRRLLAESNLIDQKELYNTADEDLKTLLDSYRSAAKAMDDTTDSILETLDKYYGDQQKDQQKGFINDIYNNRDMTGEQWIQTLQYMLMDDNLDEKTRTKIENALSDGWVSGQERAQLKKSLISTGMSTNTMQGISNYLYSEGYTDWGDKTYVGTENMSYFSKLASTLSDVTLSEEKFMAAVEELDSKNLRGEFEEATNQSIKEYAALHAGPGRWYNANKQYRRGSNYITSDQVATLHEGEAVIPKQYNPEANKTELEMLRKYYQDSANQDHTETMNYFKEVSETLSDIKDFLQSWKEDNTRREIRNTASSRLSSNTSYAAHYLTI